MITDKKKYGTTKNFIESKLANGLVSFSHSELMDSVGLSSIAAYWQIRRQKDYVIKITSRQPFYLIVQPEHRIIGAPPVEWWIDDYFVWLGQKYYIALQSAASIFGSSQQAIQETQIITAMKLRDIVVGKIRLRFFTKSIASESLTQQVHGSYAPLVVSTAATTVFDLIKYSTAIGGIERAAETIDPILDKIKPEELKLTLQTESNIAISQRLGFLLENLGCSRLSNVVEEWLPQRLEFVPLSTYLNAAKDGKINKKWNVIDNSGGFEWA